MQNNQNSTILQDFLVFCASLLHSFSKTIWWNSFKPKVKFFRNHLKSPFLRSFVGNPTSHPHIFLSKRCFLFGTEFWKVSRCRVFQKKVESSVKFHKLNESSKIIEIGPIAFENGIFLIIHQQSRLLVQPMSYFFRVCFKGLVKDVYKTGFLCYKKNPLQSVKILRKIQNHLKILKDKTCSDP